jgi:hypothetical protein
MFHLFRFIPRSLKTLVVVGIPYATRSFAMTGVAAWFVRDGALTPAQKQLRRPLPRR